MNMDAKVLGEMFERAQERRGEDMKFSTEEADRFKKAFEDPEFRKMFADYMDEIQDPRYREETEQYISQLETEDKVPEGKQLIRPSPGFVAKTYKWMDGKDTEKDKIFINIVQSDKIAEPTKQSTPKGDCWSLPYSLGPPHMEKDKKGDNSTCFDCCYHPMALSLGSMNTNFRNMLVTTAMDGVEEAYKRQGHKVTLDRQFHVVKGISYKEGAVPTMMVAVSSLENWNQNNNNNSNTVAPKATSSVKVTGSRSTVAAKTNDEEQNAPSAAPNAASTTTAPTASAKTTAKKTSGPAIKKGFLNSSKKSIYEDKIPTIRPKKQGAHDGPVVDEEETKGLSQEEESLSRMLGDLSVNDKATTSNSSKGKKAPVLPLDGLNNTEASATEGSRSALDAAAALSLGSSAVEKGGDDMLKAVSSKTRPKTRSESKETTAPVTAAPITNPIDEKLPPAVPKVVVKHRDNASLGDFEGTAGSTVASTRPKELIYEIQLPMVTAPSKIVLDVSEKRLCLTYQETYKLDMALPYKVVDKKGKAAFDKSKKALIVTLPIETVATVSTESSSVTPPPSGITELSSTEQEEQTDSPPKANGARNKATNRASGEDAKQKKHDRWVSEPAEALSSSDTLKKEIMEAAEKAKKEAEIAARTPKAVVAVPKKAVESSANTNSTTAQLDRELAQAADQSKDYIPAIKFVGRKPGYVFHMGDRGLGYYLDTKAPVTATVTTASTATAIPESPLPMPTAASTATEVQRKDIPFEVRERGQTVVFLFQVAQIVADSVHISRNHHQIAIRFDAIAPEDITGSNKLHFGNVFDFSSVVAVAAAAGDVSPLFSGVTHDVAAKNMVLLLTKAAPGTLSTDAQEKWFTTLPYAEVKEAAPVDSTQKVTSTAANTTPVKSPSKSVASTMSATATATPSAAPATSTSTSTPSTATVKSLISSLQFSSDLVNELD